MRQLLNYPARAPVQAIELDELLEQPIKAWPKVLDVREAPPPLPPLKQLLKKRIGALEPLSLDQI